MLRRRRLPPELRDEAGERLRALGERGGGVGGVADPLGLSVHEAASAVIRAASPRARGTMSL